MSFSDLPLLFDLFQPLPCKVLKDGSPCTCSHEKAQKQSSPLVSDKRLCNWEKWMEKRKQIHQKLGAALQRDPGNLVMNSAEEFRFIKEEKLALEYTKILEPDLQRGCPGFWKLPYAIKNKCGEETYFSVKTKEDNCEIPVIEHVGLSDQILSEKDVLPRVRNSRVLWNKLPYLRHKTLELSHRIQQIDPHKPDVNRLCIKGTSIKSKTSHINKESAKLKFSKLKTPESSEIFDVEPKEKPSILSLSVNNLQLNPHLQISGTRKVYTFFDYDLNSKSVATEYLTLRNLGSTAIRFYWKASEKSFYFKDIMTDTNHEIYFYFNKNEGLIIPGQTIEFPIWFKAKETGTYYEQWEFYTKPNAMPPNTRLIIMLHATATFGNIDEKIEMIQDQLNKSVRDRLIKEALHTIISNVPCNKSKPTVYYYNKKDIFEAINSQFDLFHRRPKYIYNKDIVRELQRFYKRVRRPTDPKNWNYHINELKIITKAKQKEEESQKRDAEHKISKKIYEARPTLPKLDCTRTTFPKLVESKNKIHKVPSKTSKSDSKLPQNIEKLSNEIALTEQLELIISKLEHAATDVNAEQTKYTQAYLILSTCFSKIGREIEDLKSRLGIVKNTNYPKLSINCGIPLYRPTRLIYEQLDDVLRGPSLACKVGTNADKPAAEILKDIPMEDSKRRYRFYYSLPDTPPPEMDKKSKPAKGNAKVDKKTSGKDDKKDKKKEEKVVKIDSDEDDKHVINELFDPYAKVELAEIKGLDSVEEEIDETESNFDQLPQPIVNQYKYNLYVIMYINLDQAIVSIINMIEMQPKENLPYPIIKEFEEPKYNRRLIDLKGLLAEENMEQFKAKLVLYKYRKHCKKDWKSIEIQRQLKHAKSDSSLWSILKSYETKLTLPEGKPISYPIDHYEDLKNIQEDSTDHGIQNKPLTADISTSSVEGGHLDPQWEDFKNVAIQKNYDETCKTDDLEEYIEKIVREISVQDLFDIKMEKATHKRSSEHVSDEEYFYDSESDVDAKLISDSSIESEFDSEENSCSCEGLGICNLPTEEECSCEGLGVCNLPTEEECSCEGLGVCNLPIEECSCDGYGECNLPVEEERNSEGYKNDKQFN